MNECAGRNRGEKRRTSALSHGVAGVTPLTTGA
jgi:hypothetical protein